MTNVEPTHPSGAPPGRPSGAAIDRRRFLTGALGVAGAAGAAAVGLSGCGFGGTSDSTAAAAPRAPFRTEPRLLAPGIEVATAPRAASPEQCVFTDIHAGTGQQGALIINRRGQLVYFLPVSDHGGNGRRITNVRVQHYRGEPVMTYWLGAMVSGHGQGNYHLFDQSYRQVAQVSAGNGYKGDLHEFRLTDRGTALLTAYGTGQIGVKSPRQLSGGHVGSYFYGVAQEVDVATGEVLLQWVSTDHVRLDASRQPKPSTDSRGWDYFHINSIEVDPDDQNLIISGRNCWAFYKVDRVTGEVIWRCGGEDSDFELDERATFRFQHHVVPHGDGLFTIFDNEGGPPQERSQSRGLVLRLDVQRRRATFVRAFHHLPRVYSSAMGSVQELSAGRTFIGWGISTWFTEYDRHGRVLLDARLKPIGVNSYRAFLDTWRGRPQSPPKLVVERSGRGATAYVSWNGATVHRRWQLLGGHSPEALKPLSSHRVDGFETAIEIPNAPRSLAVRALDDKGTALAVSATVHAG